jgi:hypothetical protein
VKLPGGERAIVDPEKLRDYVLSRMHPVGRFKAAFFASLGYEIDNWQDLDRALRAAARQAEADPEERTPLRAEVPHSEYPGGAWGALGRDRLRLDHPPRRDDAAARDRDAREMTTMEIRRLDTIVLARNLPAHGLRAGDLGAVVEIYPPDGLEVEFLTASGRTGALVTLHTSDVRRVADDDLVTVRTLDRTA